MASLADVLGRSSRVGAPTGDSGLYSGGIQGSLTTNSAILWDVFLKALLSQSLNQIRVNINTGLSGNQEPNQECLVKNNNL